MGPFSWLDWVCQLYHLARTCGRRKKAYKCTHTRIHKCANIQIRTYTNTQIYKLANTQIRKYTNTQIHKYANTQIRLVVKLSLCEHQLARLKASKSPQWKFLRRYIISLDISQYTNVEINSDIRLLYYEYGHSHGSLLLNIVRNQSEINFLITCLSSISIYRYILASPVYRYKDIYLPLQYIDI